MKKQPKKNRKSEDRQGKRDENFKEENVEKKEEVVDEKVEKSSDENEKENLNEKIKQDKEELEQLKKEVEELKNLNMRLKAEFDNFKKRTKRERAATFDLARSDLISPFLEVLDNLERATSLVEKKDKFSEGIDLVVNKFYDVLNKIGVVEIKSLGEVFDPNFHEAIKAVNDDKFEKNVVCEVFQKGFMLNDVVVRHALVVVANP